MEWSAVALIALSGAGAGAINALAGGGSLVTFPTLLALGYPPVTANVTNTVAALPGYVGSAWGYWREFSGQGRRVLVLGAVTAVGAVVGSALLLLGAESTFVAVVPWLVLASTVLLAVQPLLSTVARRRAEGAGPATERLRWAALGELGVAVYGGYFNAGLGIMMLGVLGSLLQEQLHRLNALKSVLSAVSSAVSLVFFAVFAHASWLTAAVMAVSGLFGGWAGAALGRRVPAAPLRWSVVAFGFIVFLVLLVNHAS
jgi:uncharacterized membrane protein YfcA